MQKRGIRIKDYGEELLNNQNPIRKVAIYYYNVDNGHVDIIIRRMKPIVVKHYENLLQNNPLLGEKRTTAYLDHRKTRDNFELHIC
jgi:hypothetical protein